MYQATITKGPDRWRLAEALFHDEEMDGPMPISFTVEQDGKERHLSVAIDNIIRNRVESELYYIIGVAKIRTIGRESKVIAEHVPVSLSYSVRTRNGFAEAKFATFPTEDRIDPGVPPSLSDEEYDKPVMGTRRPESKPPRTDWKQ